MNYTLPMRVVLGSRSAADAQAARNQVESLFASPMLRIFIQSRGIPFESSHVGPVEGSSTFSIPIWIFLHASSSAQAEQARDIAARMFDDPSMRGIVRANGVPIESASVGAATPYQPPR